MVYNKRNTGFVPGSSFVFGVGGQGCQMEVFQNIPTNWHLESRQPGLESLKGIFCRVHGEQKQAPKGKTSFSFPVFLCIIRKDFLNSLRRSNMRWLPTRHRTRPIPGCSTVTTVGTFCNNRGCLEEKQDSLLLLMPWTDFVYKAVHLKFRTDNEQRQGTSSASTVAGG